GLVTDVRTNMLSMLLPAGPLNVKVEGPTPADLELNKNAIVRVRGVLFAVWNATREVRVGSILMRNASLVVETPALNDPFDAILKSPRELLLFDAQATTFRRVKVRGQIVYADSTKAFLQQDGEGLRVMPAPRTNLNPGDQVEAVGYPSIGPAALLLREAVIRKIGTAELPAPKVLSELQFGQEGVDATRVRIEGQLLGWHFEQGQVVLEMQAKAHLFLARLARAEPLPLVVDSKLALEGVYLSLGRDQRTDDHGGSFELLLNSPNDILVLSKPSWWTWERLLILVGILSAILVFSAIWITQLRRVVEQRTIQLQREILEREQAEKLRAVEVERSRIARDLHDDLGASLTEITMLASKAQRTTNLGHGVSALLHTIMDKARELVSALDIIVWAVDPKDNSLQSVADYLCDFTDEYLSPSGIACRFDVPVTLPPIAIDGRLRHALFLAVKETLNNIVRHAEATEVRFQIAMERERLEIAIIDNGIGFDAPSPQGGKGLENLPQRLSQIGGRCEIESAAGKGTRVKIELPLHGPESQRDKGPG
ncbi:MAG TPA: sensor histidine kinase, partial [Candidatus Paceibacterota bacterium]|nr:sensor histidine kinase [Candidatus Paceibacterota bacterium]